MKTLVVVLLGIGMTSAFWLKAVRVIENTGDNQLNNCEKYSRSTLGVAYLRRYCDRRERSGLLCYSARLRKNDRENATGLHRDAQILE
jgi:hypothetical protein